LAKVYPGTLGIESVALEIIGERPFHVPYCERAETILQLSAAENGQASAPINKNTI
jgi:hypothetical protein